MVRLPYSFRGAFPYRLEEERVAHGAVEAGHVGFALDQHERRRPDPALHERLLGAPLVECQRQGERIAAQIGDAVELGDGRYVRLAVGAAGALGHVEEEIHLGVAQASREVTDRLQHDYLTEGTERARDGRNGLGVVPLDVLVGRLGGLARRHGSTAATSPRDVVRSLVVCKPYPHRTPNALFCWATR